MGKKPYLQASWLNPWLASGGESKLGQIDNCSERPTSGSLLLAGFTYRHSLRKTQIYLQRQRRPGFLLLSHTYRASSVVTSSFSSVFPTPETRSSTRTTANLVSQCLSPWWTCTLRTVLPNFYHGPILMSG